jgi:hypothetical protein
MEVWGAVDFFPEQPAWAVGNEPPEPRQPEWLGPPDDVLPGLVPVQLVLGRSDTAVVVLTGVQAFPTGLQMSLGIRLRGHVGSRLLDVDLFDDGCGPHREPEWDARRLKWGFELADGRRVTSVGPWPQPPDADDRHILWDDWTPDHPVLQGGGGASGMRSGDRSYWLWPLPPAGRLRVACQWLDQDIAMTVHDLDTEPCLEAARRAQPLWPSE